MSRSSRSSLREWRDPGLVGLPVPACAGASAGSCAAGCSAPTGSSFGAALTKFATLGDAAAAEATAVSGFQPGKPGRWLFCRFAHRCLRPAAMAELCRSPPSLLGKHDGEPRRVGVQFGAIEAAI